MKITRTLQTTTIYSSEIKLDNGNLTAVENKPFIVSGKLTTQVEATKLAHKKFGVTTQVSNFITTEPTLYEMDLETFIANATPVTKITETETTEV